MNSQKLSQLGPVDLVYSWVDGSDEVWRGRYAKAKGGIKPSKIRFLDYKTLQLSLLSVKAFMPWIRNIYIITSQQYPSFDYESLGATIIFQNDIIGPEAKLETFNSQVIEAYLHKIPGLSDNFLYACDDMIVGNHISQDMLFSDGVAQMTMVPHFQSTPENAYQHHLLNTRDMLFKETGTKMFHVPGHQFYSVNVRACEKTWSQFHKYIAPTMEYQFRDERSFHFIFMQSVVGYVNGWMEFNDGSHLRRKMYDGARCNAQKSDRWFRELWIERPHLFCLNSFQDTLEELKNYNEVRQNYIAAVVQSTTKPKKT